MNPSNRELLCLCILLLNVPGACSFIDLKSVNGVVRDTFYQACVHLNLLDDDSQWIATLQEASAFRLPKQLHFLFAAICCHCSLTDPGQIWQQFKQQMSEDFAVSHSEAVAKSYALVEIQLILQ